MVVAADAGCCFADGTSSCLSDDTPVGGSHRWPSVGPRHVDAVIVGTVVVVVAIVVVVVLAVVVVAVVALRALRPVGHTRAARHVCSVAVSRGPLAQAS